MENLDTILSNIEALVSEVKSQMSAGAGMDDEMGMGMDAGGELDDAQIDSIMDEEEEVVENADLTNTGVQDKNQPAKEVHMSIVKKEADVTSQSDGATGSDDADERVDGNQPKQSLENANEVAKTLGAINNLARVVGTVVKNQNQMDLAFKNLLDGLGVTEQIQVAHKSEQNNNKVEKSQADGNNDVMKSLLTEISKLNSNSSNSSSIPKWNNENNGIVNKSLTDANVLQALVCGQNK